MTAETSDAKTVIRMARLWRKKGLLDADWPCDKYGQRVDEGLAVIAAMTGRELAEQATSDLGETVSISTVCRAREEVLIELLEKMRQ